MTDKAEFERLLDVYGFRCERFGQDLSTHARAQVVSAFAALASASVAGEAQKPVAWMLVGRLKNSEPKFTLADPAGIYESVYAPLYAAPQASAEARPSLDAVDLARAGMALHAPGAPEHTVCAELVRLADALKQPQADKAAAPCTCPSGDGSLRHPCPMHPGTDKDGGQQRAGDAIRDLIAKHAELLESSDYVYFELARTRQTGWMAWLCSHPVETNPDRKVLARGQGVTPDEACRAAMADFDARAALSAPQAEQGERD